jgi:hypothetical protein
MPELTPRFTNKALRILKETHDIDLLKIQGTEIMDPDFRLKVTQAGCAPLPPETISRLVDDLTPGEHIDMLTASLTRDLAPKSNREAQAKAAAGPKSGEAEA